MYFNNYKECPNCGCDDFNDLGQDVYQCTDCGNLVDGEGDEI
jgi:ribosomal protein L37AE/L43A